MREDIQKIKFVTLKVLLRVIERRNLNSLDRILDSTDGCSEGFLDKLINFIEIMAIHDKDNFCFILGLCYEFGIGINKSIMNSFYWYIKSAQLGNSDAQWCVGFYYENLRSKISYEKALYWYEQSANQGNIIGLYLLLGNKATEENITKFSKIKKYYDNHYSENIIFNTILSQLNIRYYNKLFWTELFNRVSYIANELKNKTEIISILKNIFYTQKIKCSLFICFCYMYGWGTLYDDNKASFWYMRYVYYSKKYLDNEYHQKQEEWSIFRGYKYSAKKNSIKYQYLLSLCYLYGFGTPINYIGAYYWAKCSALYGYAPSQYLLACFYLEGIGVQTNLIKAHFWALKSAKQNYLFANLLIKYGYGYSFIENNIGLIKTHMNGGHSLF